MFVQKYVNLHGRYAFEWACVHVGVKWACVHVGVKVGGAVRNMPPKLARGCKGKTPVGAGVPNCRPADVRIKEVVLV